MSNFLFFIFNIIFITAMLAIYIYAYFLFKPFRIHKRRKISTISQKVSYFLFLFILLISFYYFIVSYNNETIDQFHYFNYLLIIMCLILPNGGILFRRNIKKYRTLYNYIFTLINLSAFIYFIYLIIYSPGPINKFIFP